MADFPTSTKVYDLGGTGVRIMVEQSEYGTLSLRFAADGNPTYLEPHVDREAIAALGFPTEPPEPSVEVAEEVTDDLPERAGENK